MHQHIRRAAAGLVALLSVLALTLVGVTPASAAGTNQTAASAPAGTAALGLFTQNLYGVSAFTEQGSNINLRGWYRGLNPQRSYFSVVYGNGNCDPAQAFPVGPFKARRGTTHANVTVPNPTGVDLAQTGSISVRIGDTDRNGNPTDQDGDGKTGPTDVVAIAGNPSVGLVECDTSPFTN